jgi:Bacterial PH domain
MARWEDDGVSSPAAPQVVIRISAMAHFAVGFLALGLLALVVAGPEWFALLLFIPVMLSVSIVRYRTVADRDSVTARTLLGSQTVSWSDIAGLRFGKSSWAYAQLKDETELRLPAVTFATLPLLTQASDGRVPNPYQ